MKKNAKKLWIGFGAGAAGAAAFAAASYSFTKRLVRIALDREAPPNSGKAQRRLSGENKNGELFERIKTAAEKLENSEYETIEITARDGECLIGHFRRCENAKRIIIAMHGWRSSWSTDFGAISDFWYSSGCSVLYAEQRGQNNSGGDYMGFGMIERYDCLDWINRINETEGKNMPVYLAGISMGAATVLMTAGLELPRNVCGIMADCGYTSAHDIWKHVVKNNLHMLYNGVIGAVANEICRRKINMTAKDCSTVEAMQNNSIPVLFIHGGDDHFVPIEMTYENYKACAAPKRLLVVPGAEHCMSYLTEPDKYEEITIKFWQECDNKTADNNEESEADA